LFTVIDDLAGTDSEALGINNKGDIAGFYFKQDGTESGFVRINGSDRDFVYPGSAGTEVWAINDRRQVAGGAFTNSGRSVGFSFAGGRFQALQYPLAKNTAAYGMDNNGNVVGYYEDAGGMIHGFLRTR